MESESEAVLEHHEEERYDIFYGCVSETEDEVHQIEDMDCDYDNGDIDDDAEPNFTICTSSDSETDRNISDNNDSASVRIMKYVTKSGRAYVPNPPRPVAVNIIRGKPGLPQTGKVQESFGKFFTDEVVSKIVQHTSEEAERRSVEETSPTEIFAFIGSLIFLGANNYNNLDSHDLWSQELGRSVYIASMSRNRFRELLSSDLMIRTQGRLEI
ncbi:hypothetical protein ANN_17089 [Periplaneta americana]|uniref:PiggyBac transposable element-derived protein domain-containing protein n=1 Tax=Periplaneta americana TaxID=6978 RepID=A0ABQ8STD8_PERAM|nr:hypothetical protein ANN_17089 [Periplaneta americana]